MALLNRFRGIALVGVAAFAVGLPALPAVAAPQAAPAAVRNVVATGGAKPSTLSLEAIAERRRKTSSASRAAARARTVVARGLSLRGVPYRYGGSSPSGFDCSGFTSYVYRKAGISLPRTASAQRRATRWISRSGARSGDLVFFHKGGRVYHVGIFVGGNRVLHSPRPGQRVKVASIWTRSVTFGRAG